MTITIRSLVKDSELSVDKVLWDGFCKLFIFSVIDNAFLVRGTQAICCRVYCPISKACGRVAVGLNCAILLLQVDIAHHYVVAWEWVTACKFHGLGAFCSPTNVAVHDLANLHSWCLKNEEEELEFRIFMVLTGWLRMSVLSIFLGYGLCEI